MNHQKMILLQTLRDAEAPFEEAMDYNFHKVQISFSRLIKDRIGEDWMVLSMRGSNTPTDPEYASDDRILIFYHPGELYRFSEHILIYEEANDTPIFHHLQFNFSQTADDDQVKGYKR